MIALGLAAIGAADLALIPSVGIGPSGSPGAGTSWAVGLCTAGAGLGLGLSSSPPRA